MPGTAVDQPDTGRGGHAHKPIVLDRAVEIPPAADRLVLVLQDPAGQTLGELARVAVAKAGAP